MEGNKLISIIVPVYNLEKYVSRCLDSILCQTYTTIEVIVVNDGSTDRSGLICDEYAQKDIRVKIIHQSNQGMSEARNNGLAHANGSYVSFIDSDDWIAPDMYSRFHAEIVKYHADMVISPLNIATDSAVYTPRKHENKAELFNKQETLEQLALGKLTTSACAKLYRKEILKRNPFPKDKYYEDLYAMPDIINRCDKILSIDTPYYYYYKRENSTVHTLDTTHLESYIEALTYRNNKIEKLYPNLKRITDRSQVLYYSILYFKIYDKIKKDKDIKKISHIIRTNMQQFSFASLKGLPTGIFFSAFTIKYLPHFCGLLVIIKKIMRLMKTDSTVSMRTYRKING